MAWLRVDQFSGLWLGAATISLMWLGLACSAPVDLPPVVTELPAGFELGQERSCELPTTGFARLTENHVGRGVSLDLPQPLPHQCSPFPPGLVAEDLDGDGDVDLAFPQPTVFPLLFRNHGDGQFEATKPGPPLDVPGERIVMSLAAVDTSGDGLPELYMAGPNFLYRSQNLGSLSFSAPEPVFDRPEYPWSCFNSMAWGDADGDGDLDVFLPGLLGVPDADWWELDQDGPWVYGADDLMLLQDADGFVPYEVPAPASTASLAYLSVFTDRDGDSRSDLLITSDRSNLPWWPEGVFLSNQGNDQLGRPIFGLPAVGPNMPGNVSGMGLVTDDFGGDGFLDYCMSDFARTLACFESDGQGGYIDISLTTGLSPSLPGFPLPDDDGADWVPWSITLTDLDNDGLRDFATVAGPTPGFGSVATSVQVHEQPNAIWQGLAPGRFVERTEQLSFGDPNPDYGLVAADLSGDGYPELIVSPWSGTPKLYDNPCGAQAWLEVELVGPAGNSQGIGARLDARAGDWRHTEELHAVLGPAQAPSRFHLGLGDRDLLDQLVITWPDGQQMSATSIATRRLLRVVHPDAR